jgi:nucleoprotein TPR
LNCNSATSGFWLDHVYLSSNNVKLLSDINGTLQGVRAVERRKLEDEVNKLQKEWAEAKTELEMERAHGQNLIAQRDKAVSEALERVEVASKELAEALKAVSTAETRAQVAEVILFAWIVITH